MMKKILLVQAVVMAFLLEGCLHKITPLEKCNKGDARACLNLGYSNSKNPVKANQAFRRACLLGNQYGCVNLVYAYREDGRGTKKDIKKASYFAQRACKLGNKDACTMRTRPKTAEEIKRDEEASQRLVDCMVKIDKCKSKCLSNYNPNYRGSTLGVAQYQLNAGLCVQKCKTMKCF